MLMVVLLLLGVGLILGAVIGSSLTDFRQEVPAYSQKLSAMSERAQQWLSLRGFEIDAQQWQNSFDPGAVMKLVGSTLASFGNVMTNAVMILLTVILTLEAMSLMVYALGGKSLSKALQKSGNVRLMNRIAGTLMIGVAGWLALG